MSEEITLSLPISTLEELRCFMCKGYLSCSPVRVLPYGNYICGRCSPLNAVTLVDGLVGFEKLLSKISFPCVFKKFGCPETFLFGKAADHELKCVHKPFACPINNSRTCSWEQLFHHFKDDHSNILKDKAEFALELDKDVQGILLTTEDAFAFIVKYFYNANEKILKYDVRICSNQNGLDVFSKMRLINGTDADCSINLKQNECFLYDESFYGMQNAKILNINKFLESLGDPDCVVVALKLKVDKSNSNSVTTAGDGEINYDLMKACRCYKCQNYLVPPLFDLDGETICCDCGNSNSNSKLSNDTELLKHVNEAVYPCCWRKCNFKVKSNIYKDHVMNCLFRQYRCVYNNCNDTFKLDAAVYHFRTHDCIVYLSDKITYKTSFAQNYPMKDIVTMINNRMIIIKHAMIIIPLPMTLNINPLHIHHVQLYTSPEDSGNISGIVDFEHKHCILKSKEFNLISRNALEVRLEELPPHFKKTDKLTVTVKLIA